MEIKTEVDNLIITPMTPSKGSQTYDKDVKDIPLVKPEGVSDSEVPKDTIDSQMCSKDDNIIPLIKTEYVFDLTQTQISQVKAEEGSATKVPKSKIDSQMCSKGW